MHAELLAIVALAARTNHLANGLQVPVDAAFDAAPPPERAPRAARLRCWRCCSAAGLPRGWHSCRVPSR